MYKHTTFGLHACFAIGSTHIYSLQPISIMTAEAWHSAANYFHTEQLSEHNWVQRLGCSCATG